MSQEQQIERQKRFYDTRRHHHLQPREEEPYAEHLVECASREIGLGPGDRVLEVGAGFGRFTFHLLDRCAEVTALDLSPAALETLGAERDRRGIPETRCRTWCADLYRLPEVLRADRFDAVVGFFLLHHLPDHAGAIAGLAPLLRPGGRLAFIEPNRRNPLFALQLACCPDMTWREEKGMFQLSGAAVLRHYRAAGLLDAERSSVGFFPPPLVNRFAAFRDLEGWLEERAWLSWIRPMLLLSARSGDAA
jgi:SAM-dependent methyltransferase